MRAYEAEDRAQFDVVSPAGTNGGSERAELRSSHAAGRGTAWPRVSVVVPALNEAANLVHVLPRIPEEVFEVILVDGASTDGTADVARSLVEDVRVLHQPGRGKGDALTTGFAAAEGEIIVMLDADGSARPEEISQFIDVLLNGADVAKGSRFLDGGGSDDITPMRHWGNRALGFLVNLLFGTRYSDLCYGYNAFWAHCLNDLRINCDGFEVETLINIRAAKANLTIVEVPSHEERRVHGVSNLNAVRDGFRVLRTIFRERFERSAASPDNARRVETSRGAHGS